MKKNIRKIYCCILVCLLIFVLAGCGQMAAKSIGGDIAMDLEPKKLSLTDVTMKHILLKKLQNYGTADILVLTIRMENRYTKEIIFG